LSSCCDEIALPVAHSAEGEVIDLGDLRLQVMHLPGRTPGSVALYEPKR
jgi:glyoxylase-like metal-dependent hydrolase (beta-lactamase superfamily II)